MPQTGQMQGQGGQLAREMSGEQFPLQTLTGLLGLAQQFGLGGQQQDFRSLTRQALTDARTNRPQFRQPFEVPKAQRPQVKDVFAEREKQESSLQKRIDDLERQLAQQRDTRPFDPGIGR